MRQRLIFPYSIVWLFVFSAVFFCLLGSASADVMVDATLSHQSIPVGKAARLTVTMNGVSRSADVQLPEVQGVRFHNRGQSSRINMVNGSISSSISNEYLVQPLQTGTYTIPPIQVTAGGQVYTTEPINFEATGPSSQTLATKNHDSEDATDKAVFIRVSKTGSHYPGEIVPITIKAFFDQQYRADIQSLPTLQGDGVVMAPLNDQPQQTQESMGGKMYNVLTWKSTLSGVKIGEHPISFALDASLLIPQKRRSRSTFGGSSLFNDAFFNSMFDDYQRKPIAAVSPKITFNVLPLPTEGQMEDGSFTGAIGDFELKVSASPLDVGVGEPITLTIEVSGKGNFDRVEAPLFPKDKAWKTYSPTANSNNQGSKSVGSKVFEQAIVAKTDTVSAIPSLSFRYFNPVKKKYITKTSPPIKIKLQKSETHATAAPRKAIVEQPRPALSAPAESFQGLAPIQLKEGAFSATISPIFKRMWFIALFGTFTLMLLGLILYRIRLRNLEQHPEIRLKKLQNQQLENDLEQMKQAKNGEDSMAFLSGCRVTIQNQLGPLWDIEPSAISLTDLTTRLQPESGLIEIFAAAEQAVYGAASLSSDKMAAYSATVIKELEELS